MTHDTPSTGPNPVDLAARHESEILDAAAQVVAAEMHIPVEEARAQGTLLKEESFPIEGQEGVYGFFVVHPSGFYGVQATLKGDRLEGFVANYVKA